MAMAVDTSCGDEMFLNKDPGFRSETIKKKKHQTNPHPSSLGTGKRKLRREREVEREGRRGGKRERETTEKKSGGGDEKRRTSF